METANSLQPKRLLSSPKRFFGFRELNRLAGVISNPDILITLKAPKGPSTAIAVVPIGGQERPAPGAVGVEVLIPVDPEEGEPPFSAPPEEARQCH